MAPPTNPFPYHLPPDTAAKIAERRTAKLRAEAGLFADLVPPVTPEDVQAGARAQHDQFQSALETLEERAARDRTYVAVWASAEELAELDARRAALPPSAEYAADFWGRWRGRFEADPACDLD